ncbi:MAG: VOC family protein [Gemmatimonadaceae bacterium]|nr:VOC family protein [Gemmatimonadaceae bacterium]
MAFVPTCNPKRARGFYEDILGLRFVSEDQFALVLDANGVAVRLANVSGVRDVKPASFTILGWQVRNAQTTVRELRTKGVTFEHFPGMEQDSAGIWTSPGGAKVAWFKDPDGNILSITEA